MVIHRRVFIDPDAEHLALTFDGEKFQRISRHDINADRQENNWKARTCGGENLS